jgi:hypothetical protein
MDEIDGLRSYLYENDPQFDRERLLYEVALTKHPMCFGRLDELQRDRTEEGFRTLNSSLRRGGFRSPRVSALKEYLDERS